MNGNAPGVGAAVTIKADMDDKIKSGSLLLQEVSILPGQKVTIQNLKNVWYIVA